MKKMSRCLFGVKRRRLNQLRSFFFETIEKFFRYCFVDFESDAQAEKVFRLTKDGLNINGKTLRVRYAKGKGEHNLKRQFASENKKHTKVFVI